MTVECQDVVEMRLELMRRQVEWLLNGRSMFIPRSREKEQTEALSNVYCCCANSLERKKLKVAVDEQNNAKGFKTLRSAFLPADFGAKVNFCEILF